MGFLSNYKKQYVSYCFIALKCEQIITEVEESKYDSVITRTQKLRGDEVSFKIELDN